MIKFANASGLCLFSRYAVPVRDALLEKFTAAGFDIGFPHNCFFFGAKRVIIESNHVK